MPPSLCEKPGLSPQDCSRGRRPQFGYQCKDSENVSETRDWDSGDPESEKSVGGKVLGIQIGCFEPYFAAVSVLAVQRDPQFWVVGSPLPMFSSFPSFSGSPGSLVPSTAEPIVRSLFPRSRGPCLNTFL